MGGQHDIRHLRLDPSTFNQAMYVRLLKHYLHTYPVAQAIPDAEDVKRWFGAGASAEEKAAFDAECQAICGDALAALGPERLVLPPFESHEGDRALWPTFAAPFLREFNDEAAKPQLRDREDAALALMLLLDQMTRNCFRDEAQGVVYVHYDRLARAVGHAVCETGFDRVARWADAVGWRNWFYMPLIHSEDIVNVERLLAYDAEMLEAAKARGDDKTIAFLKQKAAFEKTREDALRRFGRYPSRNKWMGRETTPEEQKFLDENKDKFSTA